MLDYGSSVNWGYYNYFYEVIYNQGWDLRKLNGDYSTLFALFNIFLGEEPDMSVQTIKTKLGEIGFDVNKLPPEYITALNARSNTLNDFNLLAKETEDQMSQIGQLFNDLHNLFGG